MNATAHATAVPASGPQLDNRRVLAGLIDLGVVLAGAFVIGLAAGLGGVGNPGLATSAVVTGWALYYYFACESGGGQTLGKRLMRIRVVQVDGSPAGMGAIGLRTLLRMIDGLFLYLVGLIVMLATGERRGRLGDLAAGTMIVSSDAPMGTAAAVSTVAPAVVSVAPVVAPVAPAEPEPVPEPEAAEPEEEPVLVNSVETISAIDLVMDDEEEDRAGT